MILHGATIIDGTGTIPMAATQMVIEQNRIFYIRTIDMPGLPLSDAPEVRAGDKVIDVKGMYVMPGFKKK